MIQRQAWQSGIAFICTITLEKHGDNHFKVDIHSEVFKHEQSQRNQVNQRSWIRNNTVSPTVVQNVQNF